jgi:hypothetical protein
MTFRIAWAALRRRPFSLSSTAFLVTVSASLLGFPVPLALLLWLATSLVALAAWHAAEVFVLKRWGVRAPSRLERERLGAVLESAPIEVLVADRSTPWIGWGLRSVVISSAVLELLEDRALGGLLTQVTAPTWSGAVAGRLLVWIGNTPVVITWGIARCLAQLGRLLAVAVGASLVLPLLIWPAGFVRVVGRVFGAALVALVGLVLVSSGLAALGLGLLTAWAVVPGVRALVAWEWRRAEMIADQATIDAGLGWQLLEALETLVWAESAPRPTGVLGLLAPAGAPIAARADRVWRAMSEAEAGDPIAPVGVG